MRHAALFFLLGTSLAFADAEQDWQALLKLDAGPGREVTSVEDALKVSLEHLDKQEKALRGFLKDHPADRRAFPARLRLARLLGMRAELQSKEEPDEVPQLLAEAEPLIVTPKDRADFDSAQLGRLLRRWQGKRPPAAAREEMLTAVRTFQQKHPKDPRVPILLVEMANLFEGSVSRKEAILKEADRLTSDPGLKAQIADDLKRIGFLGREIPLRFTGMDGKAYSRRSWAGKPVVVLFFATSSAPARAAFIQLQEELEPYGNSVAFVGISLDQKKEDVERFLAERKISIPVAWDGRGWNGPLVMALGINAVPSAWILDQDGRLRTLDALEDPAGLLKQLR